MDLGLPAVLGSAVLAFGFIPPLCAFVCPRSNESRFFDLRAPLLTLTLFPALRDATFFVVIACVLVKSLDDGQMEMGESAGLLVVQVVRVFSLIARRTAAIVPPPAKQTAKLRCSLVGTVNWNARGGAATRCPSAAWPGTAHSS